MEGFEIVVLFILFIHLVIFGFSVYFLIEVLRKGWNELSGKKRVFVWASSIYILCLVSSFAYYSVSTILGLGCPALVDTVKCRFVEIPFYVAQLMTFWGISMYLLTLLLSSAIILIKKEHLRDS